MSKFLFLISALICNLSFSQTITTTSLIGMQTQNSAPTTGQTVVFTDDSQDRTLSLSPAGALLALTITFPSDANSRLGQLACVTSSQAVTTLSLTGGVTVQGIATSLVLNDFFCYQKIAANTWRRR